MRPHFENKWSLTATVLLVLIFFGALFAPIPFLSRAPGPVFDVLGEVDGEPILTIEGAESFPTTGELDMTTVSEAGGTGGSLNVLTAVLGIFDQQASVVPAKDQYPNGTPTDEDREVSQKVFEASQTTALAAAANYVGRPVTTEAVVFDVIPDGPSVGKLQAGDHIRTVNGEKVTTGDQVGEIVSALPIGSTVTFEIVRDNADGVGEDQTVEVQTEAAPVDEENPDGEQKSVVGIYVDNRYESDFTADFALEDIGGPSAGLVFSMAMVDKLQGENLIDGRHVAGTGTIDAEGRVGPIGGIDKKMIAAQDAGAQLFLAPFENCAEVVESTPEGLTVTAVASLSEAIDAVQAWTAGREVPSCPVDPGAEQSS